MKRKSKSNHDSGKKALPRSREVLSLLLEEVQRFISEAEGFQQRQRYRLNTVKAVLENPVHAAAQRHVMIQAAGDESRKHWAQGIPSIRLLILHTDEALFQEMVESRQRALEVLNEVAFPRTPSELENWCGRLRAIVEIEDKIIGLFVQLQNQIVVALEDGADTSADTTKKLLRIIPQDIRILRLYNEIEAKSSIMSQNDVAKEFVEIYGGDAQTLLRGVRRFRERLKRKE